MRRVTVSLPALILSTLFALPGALAAGPAAGPCDSEDKLLLGGFQSDDELGCNGQVVCPDNAAAAPCAFELSVSIGGTGIVEAAGFARGTVGSCLEALACTFTVPFTVDANSTAAWACWGAVRTFAVDVTLTCSAA